MAILIIKAAGRPLAGRWPAIGRPIGRPIYSKISTEDLGLSSGRRKLFCPTTARRSPKPPFEALKTVQGFQKTPFQCPKTVQGSETAIAGPTWRPRSYFRAIFGRFWLRFSSFFKLPSRGRLDLFQQVPNPIPCGQGRMERGSRISGKRRK